MDKHTDLTTVGSSNRLQMLRQSETGVVVDHAYGLGECIAGVAGIVDISVGHLMIVR